MLTVRIQMTHRVLSPEGRIWQIRLGDKQANEPVLLRLRESVINRGDISARYEPVVKLRHVYHGPMMNSV
jgi:hypothetical protein